MTANQLIGQSMVALFPGVKQTTHWQALSAAFVSGKPQHFETTYSYNGHDQFTDNWITRLDEDRLISVYSIINEQKQAESLAKQRSSILQSVLDGCQTAIVLFEAIRDQAGKIIDFKYLIQNEANARLLGYPISETNSKTMLEVLPNLKASGIFDRYVAVTETGQPQQFEQHFTDGRVDGWFNISIVKQDDGFVVAANDLTLLHQTLQRTEQLVSELQRSNHNLEQFAYVASHDLQEPLRKIQSFGNLIIDLHGHHLPEEGQMMLRRMQSAAERMSQLIRDLLAYSRLTGDKDSLVPVRLSALIADILTDLELVIREKKAQLTIHTDLDDTLPTLTGNPMQLRQLFQNLLSNALKFVRPGLIPKISINIQSITADDVPISIPNWAKQPWVAINISDNGIGFDQKYKEQIFQLFERLHGRSEYTGTGIGLAICRKVAENHGGTITAHSKPNEGSTFTVYLPA
ncbi:sensor histidine kinase [Spirosoma aerophilum]